MSKFEDMVLEGIVQQFFKPTITGTNPTTGEYYYGSTPAAMATNVFFNQNREQITKLVIDKLDVQDVADKVYEQLIEYLAKKETNSYGYDQSSAVKKEFNESVRKQVVSLVAKHQANEIIDKQAQKAAPTPIN